MGNVINKRATENDRVLLVDTGEGVDRYKVETYYKGPRGNWEKMASMAFSTVKEAQEEFMWASKDLLEFE